MATENAVWAFVFVLHVSGFPSLLQLMQKNSFPNKIMDLDNQNESSSFPYELQNSVPPLTARNNEVEDDTNSQVENFQREAFGVERMTEIHNSSDIGSRCPFPLARIKRIVKSNGKVERIGADATLLIAKACEFFIMELTSRAWFKKQENTHLTLQHWDIGRALISNNRTNFLAHIVRANLQKEAMRNLKETMLWPAHPLQLQNLNPPEELNKETDPRLGNPMHSLRMSPAFLLGNQEILQLFSPSTSSVPLNYHPGSKEEPSERSG